jgi:hypothetical protein
MSSSFTGTSISCSGVLPTTASQQFDLTQGKVSCVRFLPLLILVPNRYHCQEALKCYEMLLDRYPDDEKVKQLVGDARKAGERLRNPLTRKGWRAKAEGDDCELGGMLTWGFSCVGVWR